MSFKRFFGSRLKSTWSRWPLRVFLGLGSGLLLVGLVRYELVALLWGGLIAAAGGYFLLGGVALRWGFFPSQKWTFHSHWDTPVGVEDHEIILWYQSHLPTLPLPGFRWVLRGDWTFGERRLCFEALLSGGVQNGGLAVKGPRGDYSAAHFNLYLEDVFGFVCFGVAVSGPGQMMVGARSGVGTPLGSTFSRWGSHRVKAAVRPADDLLDLRRYYPGDDLKRIHWKLLAHSRELFLRKGEDRPPPRGACFWWFDPWWPWDPLTGAEFLDRRLRLFLGAVDEKVKEGYDVTVASPHCPQGVQVSTSGDPKLRAWSSGVVPLGETEPFQHPLGDKAVYTLPGSPLSRSEPYAALCPWLGGEDQEPLPGWWQRSSRGLRLKLKKWRQIRSAFKNWEGAVP